MGTGERSWGGVVAAAVLWGWGCRSEADPKTGSSSDRHRAASARPKSGVSIQSQLVWLYRTQDIYFKTFVSIFRFVFFFLTYFFLPVCNFLSRFIESGLELVLQGVPSWWSREKARVSFWCTFLPPLLTLVDLIMSAEKILAGLFLKTKSPCSVGHDMFNRLGSNFWLFEPLNLNRYLFSYALD